MCDKLLSILLVTGMGITALAEEEKPENLARKAKVTATSEFSALFLAKFVADGIIPVARNQNAAGKEWAAKGNNHPDGVELTMSWDAPVDISEIVYYGRSGAAIETFKDCEVYFDDAQEPAIKASFKSGHGPQRITLKQSVTSSKMTLKFIGHHDCLNPGASEIEVYSTPPAAEALWKFIALKPMAGLGGRPYDSPELEAMLATCASEQYKFTPKVRAAFLTYAKAQAKADLEAQGKSIPEEFLAWIDADPLMEAGVYGTRQNVSNVLLMLYSLRLDLGQADFEKYRHLALAAAVVHAKLGPEADISPREPLTLVIGGDPRKPVDTKEPGRELDMNDHIINFLNDNTIEEEVVVFKEVPPELKYDDKGIAIPAPKGKTEKVKVTEKRTRSLYAADVIATPELQQKFNEYMKSKGHDIAIDCGDRIVHWRSRSMVRGEKHTNIHKAYILFRRAYEAKGLLPAERDPIPSLAERCAYLIRNDKHEFPAEIQAKRKWPRFPLTAPWPVLTLLVADGQPLREREERWNAFCETGEFRTYGEYIGSIAQQHGMQSARRLKPHPFTYHTIQMMLKDGGVCGTMGNISARSHNTLGIPSSTAKQPGHCAMIAMRHDPKSDTYACRGGQYASGGDERTTPHMPWYFGDVDARRPMIYHQSVAWAVNYGLESYLDSNLAYAVFRLLPEADAKANGAKLLESGIEINPYNFLLTDAAQAAAQTPQDQFRFWRLFQEKLAAVDGKPGCPADGLYNTTVKYRMFATLGRLPVPTDAQAAGQIFAFLQEQQYNLPAVVLPYQIAAEGLPAVLASTEEDFKEHIKSVHVQPSRANNIASAAMAGTVAAMANCIADGEAKKQWAQALWAHAQGQEKFVGHGYRVSTVASLPLLARLSGQPMPSEPEMMKPILDGYTAELEQSVAGQRDVNGCKALAAKITAAGNGLTDPEQKRVWFESLSKIITGHETFQPAGAQENAQALRDPCADTINQALQPPKE